MKTISVKVPDEINARLEARARRVGKSKSELIREAPAGVHDEQGRSGASCLDLVSDLVGSAHGPGDLASNPKHMREYGR